MYRQISRRCLLLLPLHPARLDHDLPRETRIGPSLSSAAFLGIKTPSSRHNSTTKSVLCEPYRPETRTKKIYKNSMSFECCKSGFKWSGEPTGEVTKLGDLDTYLASPSQSSSSPSLSSSSSPSSSSSGDGKDGGRHAILMVHDIFGWTFPNARLLADAYASGTGAHVYLPDYFRGEVLHPDALLDPARRAALDLPAFLGRHDKQTRWVEIRASVARLRALGFDRVGAIGFCWGGVSLFPFFPLCLSLSSFLSRSSPTRARWPNGIGRTEGREDGRMGRRRRRRRR